METYFEQDYITIKYDDADHILFITWELAPSSEEYTRGKANLLMAIKKYNASKILWDMVRLGTILPEDMHWVASEWQNRAFELGYSHGAVIVPFEVLSQMPAETVVDQPGRRFMISYFDNMNDAMEWIRQF